MEGKAREGGNGQGEDGLWKERVSWDRKGLDVKGATRPDSEPCASPFVSLG